MFPVLLSHTLPRWGTRLLLSVSLILPLCFGRVSRAQESSSGEPPAVAIQVDLSEFAKSKLGNLLIKAGTQLAAAEMDKDPDEAMDAVIQSLGFNPLEQQIKLSSVVTDLEDPLDGLQLNVQMKDSTGNLEGLLLAAPEYRALTHRDQTIHSAKIDGRSVFIAFHTASSGRRHIAVAGTEAIVKGSLDELRAESTSDGEAYGMPAGQFVNVRLFSLPEDFNEIPPIATIARLVNECSISLGEDVNDLVMMVTLATKSEEQATQIQQLVQGAVAMLGLFKEEIRQELDGDAVASHVISVLDQIKVDRKDLTVTIQTKVPESLVIEFLREEAGLPL